MSWRYTLISAWALTMLLTSSGARAATIETAVMPGPVIEGHAKLEGDCSNCHARFDRAAQPRLCLDCHKDVRADIAARKGYHGHVADADRECRRCHTEHKGRLARIVVLREREFDHTQTEFRLLGKHKLKSCASCHRPGVRHRDAPTECVGCHRKDDRHQGGLGTSCATCHDQDGWKGARFDHAKTKFPLRRAHADPRIRCESCHVDHRYKGTPQDCASCHRDDDMKRGHKGHFGTRCEKCHEESAWNAPTFRHDRDTAYSLVERHRAVKCETCHRARLFTEKMSTRCVSCHQRDDVHKAALGDRCDKCHSPRGWKGTSFDHDADTHFPLRDRHKAAACDACHKDKGFHDKPPLVCVSCHERDDRERGHHGALGDKCDSCHDARGFKPSRFDHGRDTGFALVGRHARIECANCHRETLFRTKIQPACYGCHKDQDVHFATYGLECETCHMAEDWRKIKPGARRPDEAGQDAAPGAGRRP